MNINSENSIISVDLVRSARTSSSVPKECPDEALITAAKRYEKFILLVKENFGMGLSPSKDIDMMWHLHMLHPKNYYNDCMKIFGQILDHNGGFGSTPEEEGPLAEAFAKTSKLWEKKYNEPYAIAGPAGGPNTPVKCREQCSIRCH